MLSELKKLQHYQRALVYSGARPEVPTQLYAVGIEYRDQMSYDHDGLQRQQEPITILQYGFSGGGILIHEDHEYTVCENDLMLVRLPHRHRYRFLPRRYGGPADHWHFMFILIRGAFTVDACAQLQDKQGPVLHLNPTTPLIQSMIQTFNLMRGDHPISYWQASQLGYKITMQMMDLADGRGFVSGPVRSGMIGSVMDYCDQHYAEQIGVDEMADIAGVTRYHLSRLFKAQTGMSPGEYLIQCRMDHAARLLLETDYAVGHIAGLAGYQEANYFSKAFRKRYGKSPKQYRKEYVLNL